MQKDFYIKIVVFLASYHLFFSSKKEGREKTWPADEAFIPDWFYTLSVYLHCAKDKKLRAVFVV